MKLGLSSYAYRWSIGFPGHENPCSMSLVEFLEQAIHFGFDGVQICDNLPIYDLPVSKTNYSSKRCSSRQGDGD
jgi:hypothetical protein